MKCIALAFSALLFAGNVASAALGANTAGLTGMAGGGTAFVLDVTVPATVPAETAKQSEASGETATQLRFAKQSEARTCVC
jgi:hypothetical protein